MQKRKRKETKMKGLQEKETQHTGLFRPIRDLIFQLPVQEQIELSQAIQQQQCTKDFWETHKAISDDFKKAGLKLSDVPKLIAKARKQK